MTKASSTVAALERLESGSGKQGAQQGRWLTEVVKGQTLYSRHVAEQLEQETMQPRAVVLVALDQVEQAGKGALGLHHLKDGFIAAAVVKQHSRDNVQHRGMLLLQRAVNSGSRPGVHAGAYLQQAVNELSAHVVLVLEEKRRVDQAVAAARNVVFGVEEAVGRRLEEGAKAVVNLLVCRALRRHDRLHTLPESAALVVVVVGRLHLLAGFNRPAETHRYRILIAVMERVGN